MDGTKIIHEESFNAGQRHEQAEIIKHIKENIAAPPYTELLTDSDVAFEEVCQEIIKAIRARVI